ncbi:MAG: hypothetical protein ACFCVE_12995 [Phycisphaerae bacterium]
MPSLAPLLVAAAAVVWYVAVRGGAAAGLSLGGLGLRGVAHALPVLGVAMLAGARGRADVATGMVFGACVAALFLALPLLLIGFRDKHAGADAADAADDPADLVGTAPRGPVGRPPAYFAFVVPAAVALLLIGFEGVIGPVAAVGLLLLGVTTLVAASAYWGGAGSAGISAAGAGRRSNVAVLQLVLAAVAVAGGCWLGVAGITLDEFQFGRAVAGELATVLLAPAAVLPMIGANAALAGRAGRVAGLHVVVTFVLLNLLIVLPAASLTYLAADRLAEHAPTAQAPTIASPPTTTTTTTTATTVPTTAPAGLPGLPVADGAAPVPASGMPFDLTSWQLAVPGILAGGLLLLPVALGRTRPGLPEAALLLAGYFGYLLMAVGLPGVLLGH